jgi:pantoate--beta-alanine ligase
MAVFGQKDFQQASIIRRMVRDLNFGIEIIVAPIVREESGLAKSSRNSYLSEDEKARAVVLSQSLKLAKEAVAQKGEVTWSQLKKKMMGLIEKAGLRPDYIEAADADDLTPVKKLKKGNVILLAAYCGKTRLIDNAVM